MPDALIPIILGGIMFMIPIVAILTKHQQKMAELMRHNAQHPQGNPLENEMMRREMEQLRQLVMQQTIAIDNLASQNRELAARMNPLIEERVR
jgi:hypothetical protein